jgi:squalene-hopene/tetraprenyl-beta-curcumene cyclase
MIARYAGLLYQAFASSMDLAQRRLVITSNFFWCELRLIEYLTPMKIRAVSLSVIGVCFLATFFTAWSQDGKTTPLSWDPRAAASYLDGRQNWWTTWPNAARDHDTFCVTCHTAVPYALARPLLRATLEEHDLPAAERALLANVTERVRLWKEVEPFYADQTSGLPKTSESRGTEAVLNALILANEDGSKGALTDETRQAFNNLWALQFKTGELKGAWAWFNFGYEPWEAKGGPYFGAVLAAIAVGTTPSGYAADPDLQDRLKALRDFLQRNFENESLFNRVMALWGSTKLPALLTPSQRQAVIDAVLRLQQDDGGWSMSSLGPWKRLDGTPLDTNSDGYATGLIALVLEQSGTESTQTATRKALSWLVRHQDRTTGMWSASSLNKQRDAASDTGKFMSDAATGYAVLALTQAH